MDRKRRPVKIGTRLLIITGIFLVLTCAIIVLLVNYSMRQQALVEAESKMSIMAEQYLAIHTYFSQKLKPAVFELTDAIRSKTYFDPVWMSSTYAIREINKHIKKSKGETEYYLKDAAVNARSPENEAIPYEKEFLSELNVNPKLKEKSRVQMIDGRPYLVFLRRGEVMEASCLRCHSSPDKAPADMVRFYGPKRSFNRKIGDWVQAISIRVPLAEAYANANRFSLRLSVLLLTLLFVLFCILYFFSRRLMFKPLSVIHEKALQISTDEKKLGEEIPLPSGRELNELAIVFNSMSKSLRYHMDNLEAFVRERTSELTKANENLKIEISARKKSEQELRESEEKFENLFDNMNSGVAVYTAENNGEDFIFQDFNKAGEQIDRTSKEKVIGRSVLEMFPAVKDFGLFDVFQRVWKTGEPEHHPIAMYKDKRITGWRDNFVYRLPSGQVVSVYSDETERRQALEALRESEEKYRSILENIEDGYYETDLDGNFTFFNDSLCRIFGYSEDELMGMTYRKNTDQEAAERVYQVFNKVYITGKPIKGLRYMIFRKDGNQAYIEVSVSLIKDSKGQRIGFGGITRDVTEREVAEQGRIKLEDQLHRAQKMESLGLMAGGVAHDLNNILSGIVSYPELLLINLPEDSPLRKPIKTIQESGMRAADVVEDLMTIARGVASSKEVLNLNTVVEEYLKSVEHQKLERTHSFVNFKTELDPDLLNMSGSPIHIKKTLMNLVTNASEAIEGSGTVTISAVNQYLDEPLKGYEDVRTGEYVMLTVSDDGSGISPGDLERIFEPFYTKKVMGRSGTGLGLAVVWNTVQDHKGYINVESSEKGTVFELYFPVTREEVAAEGEKVPLEDYLGHGEKILVVDDEDRQREIASGMLTELGYKAESVSSGEEAIEYVKEHPVDLIVLDMVMPKGINGRETYEQIIKIRPDQKAIIASGYAKTKEVDTAQELGAGKYIKKPYILEKIGLAVKEELEK